MIKRTCFLLSLICLSSNLFAATGGSGIYKPALRTTVTDIPTLKRGYEGFMQNCVSCHSIELMRYSRVADDLGLTEEQMREKNLIPANAKMVDDIVTVLTAENAMAVYGVVPPDLSLKARELGVNYIHNFLNGYYQDSKSKTGFNNAYLKNTAMPNLLAGKQGMQKAVYDDHGVITGLELTSEGSMNHKQFYEFTRDMVTFLQYVAEPAILKRFALGWWVIGFLLMLLVITYLLKREYWKDIH